MDYQTAWDFLDRLQFFKIKLGLDSMTAFLRELGNPHENLRYVHIGGTNGKGSVGVTLLSMLARAGYRVGFYTSPHLSSVRERFRINDTYIPEQDFAEAATRIHAILGGRQITYFEFTTALALLWFEKEKVDLAIMEVGLGGRLDATNVIVPLVSVITNVSKDHEAYLGNTLAEIASEKAGIIKKRVPLVSCAGNDETDRAGMVLKVIRDACSRQEAPLYLFGPDFYIEDTGTSWTYWGMKRQGCCKVRQTVTSISCRLAGAYQHCNVGIALAVVELLVDAGFTVSDDAIRAALAEVHWPGRLEYFCMDKGLAGKVVCSEGARRILLDGAHNPAGVESLKQALADEFDYNRLILVWGAMADKDIANTLPGIASMADTIILTRPESERSAPAEMLREKLPTAYRARAECINQVAAALMRAAAVAAADDLICVAGSLYLVGEARRMLLGELV